MNNIKLLDCTLRDGGYTNDWEFGHNNITSILDRLEQAGTDIIEIGFLDERRPFDINRTIMPDTASAERILGKKPRNAMLVGMIDYGTCGIDRLCPASESILDGIRVIFKKHLMHEAMAFCAQVKALGYKVFSQLVSITSYNEEELAELVALVNEVKPYAVSMVDTYGLLHPDDMLRYYEQLDNTVDTEVQIGFHAHNNFQLAYANDIAFLNKPAKHDIVVDATLYGMGKSAGNSQIELVAMYLNSRFNKDYKINYYLESIEEVIMDFYKKTPWGYKMFFYLCAKNRCHPNYVTTFLKKNEFSVSDLDRALGMIEPEPKKLLYDQKIAEEVFDSVKINDSEDYSRLTNALAARNVLVIGPGKNVQLQEENIKKFISENDPVIISVNYVPESIKPDYVFVTNRKRHRQMTDSLNLLENSGIELIATSNLSAGTIPFSYKLGLSELLVSDDDNFKDNSFLMLVKVLRKCGITRINCAGFDGYSNKEDNYADPQMEYSFVKSNADHLNKRIRTELFERYADIKFNFITYSKYTETEDCFDAKF